jgi:hypothetical protein
LGNSEVLRKIKGKMEAQAISLILLRFAHHANGILTFVRLLMKKQTEVNR